MTNSEVRAVFVRLRELGLRHAAFHAAQHLVGKDKIVAERHEAGILMDECNRSLPDAWNHFMDALPVSFDAAKASFYLAMQIAGMRAAMRIRGDCNTLEVK